MCILGSFVDLFVEQHLTAGDACRGSMLLKKVVALPGIRIWALVPPVSELI